MATFQNLFDFQSPYMKPTEAPVQGESAVSTGLKSTNELINDVNTFQDNSRRLNRYSERESLMQEIQTLLGTNPVESTKEITDENGNKKTVFNDELNNKLRQMSLRVMEYVSRTNDYDFAKIYDQLLGDFMNKGLTANAAQKMINQEAAGDIMNLMNPIIQRIEQALSDGKVIDQKDIDELGRLDAEFYKKEGKNYKDVPKLLERAREWKDKQLSQTTGWKKDISNQLQSKVEKFVDSRNAYKQKLAQVKNAVTNWNSISQKMTGNKAQDLFIITKAFMGILEPGMSVSDGEVSGMNGSNEVSNLIGALNSGKNAISSLLDSNGDASLEKAQREASRINQEQYNSLKENMNALVRSALNTYNGFVIDGIQQYTDNAINDVKAVYGNALSEAEITELTKNTKSYLESLLGVPSLAITDVKGVEVGGNNSDSQLVGNQKDYEIINGKNLSRRLAPFTTRGTTDGETRLSPDGKSTYVWSVEGDNWNRVKPVLGGTKLKSTQPNKPPKKTYNAPKKDEKKPNLPPKRKASW